MWFPASFYASVSYCWLHEWDMTAGARLAQREFYLLYKYLAVCSSAHASAGTFHHHEWVKHEELPPCAWHWFSIIIPGTRLVFS